MCDKAGSFEKKTHWAKMTKNGEKWPKNMVFGLFKKTMSLVLSEICVKWKFLWFINILQKLHACEKSGSNFINRLISDFDFWHVDRHEWKKQGSLTVFLEKNSNLGKWAILGPKIAHPRNSGSAGNFLNNFAQWKGLIGRWEWY